MKSSELQPGQLFFLTDAPDPKLNRCTGQPIAAAGARTVNFHSLQSSSVVGQAAPEECVAYARLSPGKREVSRVCLNTETVLLADDPAALDLLTDTYTAFPTLDAMVNAPGNYRPSLYIFRPEIRVLADAYDKAQEACGDTRRAFRTDRQ